MASQFLTRTKRITVVSLKVAVYGMLLGLIALGVAVSVAVSQLPSYAELLRRDNLGPTIRVRALDGSIIHSQGPSFGEWIPYSRIPEDMRNAMVAVEDRRFGWHPGVDPIGIARSVAVRVRTGNWRQGGSTITQQLARNIFLNNTRTFGRKVREAILAMALEWRFTKEQVLELYLNRVYFGGGAYGIDAASRRFYGHSASELSLAEAAIIAGLVKAPSNYSPTADVEAARGRATVVLSQMLDQKMISTSEAVAADPQDVQLARAPARQDRTRYFTDWVIPQLDVLVDQEVAEAVEVWTTIDLDMQQAADRAIAVNVPSGAQGALVSLDRDGAVRAMVGGRDYATSIYNRATQANRQPGSAWKLFVFLGALQAGHEPDSLVDGGPITVRGWSPRNDSGGYPGQIPLRHAFAHSVNTAAVRLSQEVGTNTVANIARQFGITTPINDKPAMALGSSEVRLLDLTRAYASIARNGIAVAPYGVRRVTTASGTVVYEHHDDASRVLVTPWIAAQMTDLLKAVVDSGTGRAAAIGRPTAGKTGTTSANKDGWFIGFSSGLTTGVWIGRDDNKRLPGLSGGRAPAQVFHDYMVAALANRPVEDLVTEVAGPEWQKEEPSVEPLPGDDGLAIDPDASLLPEDPSYPVDPPFDAPGALPPRAPEDDPERRFEEMLDQSRNPPPPPARAPAVPPPQRTAPPARTQPQAQPQGFPPPARRLPPPPPDPLRQAPRTPPPIG